MQEVQEISWSFETTSENDCFILKYGHFYGLIDLIEQPAEDDWTPRLDFSDKFQPKDSIHIIIYNESSLSSSFTK